jgi:hypothetical protein
MATLKSDSQIVQADALSTTERILLFCVGTETSWERTGVTGVTVTSMVITGLIQRDPIGALRLTKEGRATLAAMVGQERFTPTSP